MIRERREQVAAELCEHFAADHLELDELEHRLALADGAGSTEELDALLEDLPQLPAPASAVPPPPAAARTGHGWAIACMGGSTRKGAWAPPRHMHSLAVMGGVLLDFREARLAPGVTDVTAVACMGGVTIVVPPGLPVEVRGFGLMGGVDHVEREYEPGSSEAPRLRITAFALMGGVDVKTRPREELERSFLERRARRARRRDRRR